MEFDDTIDFNYKIILVGNSYVGKTSVAVRYVSDSFDDSVQQRTAQVQILHKLVTLPSLDSKISKSQMDTNLTKTADLHIWDTLGQEKF